MQRFVTREQLRNVYQYVGDLSEDWYLVRQGDVITGTYGFVNAEFGHAIEPCFEMAYPFRGKMAMVKRNGAWNFIDERGVALFDGVEPHFLDGAINTTDLMSVKKNGKWGTVDRWNRIVVPLYFDKPVRFARFGISLREVEDTPGLWEDTEGQRMSVVETRCLLPLDEARPIKGYGWYYLEVARVQLGNQAFLVTAHHQLLPSHLPISRLEHDLMGLSFLLGNPVMKENWRRTGPKPPPVPGGHA